MLSKKYFLFCLVLTLGYGVCARASAPFVVHAIRNIDRSSLLVPADKELHVEHVFIGKFNISVEGTLQVGTQNLRDVPLETKTYRLEAKKDSIPDEFAHRVILNMKAGSKLRLSDNWLDPYAYEDDVSVPQNSENMLPKFEAPKNNLRCNKGGLVKILSPLEGVHFTDGIEGDILMDFSKNSHVYVGTNPTFDIAPEPGTYLMYPEKGTEDDRVAVRLIAYFVQNSHFHPSCPWTIQPYDETTQTYSDLRQIEHHPHLYLKKEGNVFEGDGRVYFSEDPNVLPIPGDPGVAERRRQSVLA